MHSTWKMVRTRTGAVLAATIAGTALMLAQGQTPRRVTAPPPPTTPIFRATTDLHQTSVIVRDKDGKFVPDLRAEDFEVWEDDVPQKVSVFLPSIGGRIMNASTSAPDEAPTIDGLILPPTRAHTDVSGRVFVIFIDDLHFE